MIDKKIINFQSKLRLKFNNVNLLKQSLVHKSFNNTENNEKMEFLGDRVLGLVLSVFLLKNFPNEKEGIIDKKFANLVNKKTCSFIAKDLNIKEFMYLGDSYKGQSRSDEKILSDGLEALIGAIFLDKGLKISEEFILKNWKKYLDKSDYTMIDSKTQLQEYSLKKYKELPKYKVHKQSGPQHSPVFKVEVHIKNSKKIVATGNSIKKAQQNAAKKLLIDLNI
jgi:ribonuclease III